MRGRLKSYFIIVLLSLFATITWGQKQQGYVKTRGRMVNGKHVKGQGLPGTTVKLRGRQAVVVQQQDGSFSFPKLSNNYIIDSVQKINYKIVDVDYFSREYKYSEAPIYIVMEKPERQISDKLFAEKNIRKALQKKLQEKESVIDSLMRLNKLKTDEYQQALQDLYAQQEDNEKLIRQMADQYSKLDYDQMDDFYRQFASYIDNGELVRADSLLRTRGDVNQQVSMQLEKGTAIQKEKDRLSKAESVYNATNEELSKRCFGFYESFLLQHKIDSAAHYLELRTQLDTTNIKWQNDYGEFILEYLANYAKALETFDRIYDLSIREYGHTSEWSAISLNNIGLTYDAMGKDSLALDYYRKSLDVSKSISDGRNPDVATSLNNIGYVYYSRGDFEQAIKYYEEALEICKSLYGEGDSKVATSMNNIGAVYSRQEKFLLAIEYHNKALGIYRSLFGSQHPEVATCLNNIGAVYSLQGDSAHAINLYKQALEIYKSVYTEHHPKVAAALNNIGYVYSTHNNNELALRFYHTALDIWKDVCGNHHPNVATDYNNIAHVYISKGDSVQALDYYSKALEIYKSIYSEQHPKVISCITNINKIHNKGHIGYNNPLEEAPQKGSEKNKTESFDDVTIENAVQKDIKKKVHFLLDYLMYMTDKSKDVEKRMLYKEEALSLFVGKGGPYVINGTTNNGASIEITILSTNRKTKRLIRSYFHGLANYQYNPIQEIESVDYIVIPTNGMWHVSDNTYQCNVYQYTYYINKQGGKPNVYKDVIKKMVSCQVILEAIDYEDSPEYIILLSDIKAVIK
jgi:tetratricopeptide (TPR) repeat protein